MASIELFNMYATCIDTCIDLVNTISLEPLNQSTTYLVYDVIPPIGRMQLILGSVRKPKIAAIELYNMYAIDTPCERDIFRTVLPIDFKFGLWCRTT